MNDIVRRVSFVAALIPTLAVLGPLAPVQTGEQRVNGIPIAYESLGPAPWHSRALFAADRREELRRLRDSGYGAGGHPRNVEREVTVQGVVYFLHLYFFH
jgi:hypothetical protein